MGNTAVCMTRYFFCAVHLVCVSLVLIAAFETTVEAEQSNSQNTTGLTSQSTTELKSQSTTEFTSHITTPTPLMNGSRKSTNGSTNVSLQECGVAKWVGVSVAVTFLVTVLLLMLILFLIMKRKENIRSLHDFKSSLAKFTDSMTTKNSTQLDNLESSIYNNGDTRNLSLVTTKTNENNKPVDTVYDPVHFVNGKGITNLAFEHHDEKNSNCAVAGHLNGNQNITGHWIETDNFSNENNDERCTTSRSTFQASFPSTVTGDIYNAVDEEENYGVAYDFHRTPNRMKPLHATNNSTNEPSYLELYSETHLTGKATQLTNSPNNEQPMYALYDDSHRLEAPSSGGQESNEYALYDDSHKQQFDIAVEDNVEYSLYDDSHKTSSTNSQNEAQTQIIDSDENVDAIYVNY